MSQALAALLSVMLVAIASGTAAESLIINGDFERRDAQGQVIGWSYASDGTTTLSEGGSQVLSLTQATVGSTTATQSLRLDPTWGALRFRYRVRVTTITPGSEGWHDARIALTIVKEGGDVVHTVAGSWREPTDGWSEVNRVVPLPDGAVELKISPAIFNAVGAWQLDDLLVTVAAIRGAGIDAELPPGQTVTWGQEPVEIVSPKRGTVCLNGLWRFQPALGVAAAQPQATGWGWLRVPGSWRSGHLPGLVNATGPAWETFNHDAPAGWYERDLTIPAAWAGRAILLDLQRVSTDALVLIDGQEAGRIAWPGGEVDLTGVVTPGRTHQLRVKVVAVADQTEVTRFMGMGEGQIITEKAILVARGIVGDALLTSRPRSAHLSGCGIRTTVTPAKGKQAAHGDQFSVVIDYIDLPAAGPLAVEAVIRTSDTREVRHFTASVAASAGTGSVTAAWEWPDPMLWDVDQPNLYILELTVRGSGLDDALSETFGFREFRIDGRRFLLNGTEIRLRPSPLHVEGPIGGVRELIGATLEGMRWAGFNTTELWPWNRAERGTWEFDELWCQEADRHGFLLIVPALDMTRLVSDWQRDGVRSGWAETMRPALKRLRNHPSVVMWVTGANRFGHNQDQSPEAIGHRSRGWNPSLEWRKTAEYGLDALRLIKEVDPTRPAFMHAGGPVGEVYTSNNYLCLIPLQEREEWPSQWAADGDMPVLMVEFGTPLYTTFHRGRRGYGHAASTEPQYSEYCAIYQGPAAYGLESPAYRETLAKTFDHDFLWHTWHNIQVPRMHEGFNRLQALFQTNTWRTWRTWGVTGGLLPWANGHGWLRDEQPSDPLPAFVAGRRGAWRPQAPRSLTNFFRPSGMPLTVAGKALVAANQKTLAWIAGAPDFTDKTHHFRAGAAVTKQIALINDERVAQSWTLSWQAELGGVTCGSGRAEGELAPASNGFAPLSFTLPKQLAASRVSGSLSLTCTIGESRHEDRFTFHAFRAENATPLSVSLLDPVGDTTALLRTLGVANEAWDGKPSKRLLVVGRNAFASGKADPTALGAVLGAGGRVLLMAQDPDWLRRQFGLRVSRQLTRRAFPVIADHPALAGLDAEAFRDWAGSSHLIAERQADPTVERTPPYGWRWGGRHAVSSAAIEIPHRASWRPLLNCEFDGAYSPLLEVASGKGVVTVCTLDLEDHAAADPAAERIARAVLAAAAATPITPRAPVHYLGGAAGAAVVAEAGILSQAATALPAQGVVVIGADAVIDDAALSAFLTRGGRALILPRQSATAPLGITLKQVEHHGGALEAPSWASCRGLGVSDLRRRTDGPAWIISGGSETIAAQGLLAEVRRGSGVAVFCQLDVGLLEADRLTYNRFTRWRWTRALNQLASNLGAACVADERLFDPLPPQDISLAGTWKAALTLPLRSTGANEARPADPGISQSARALVVAQGDETKLQDVIVGTTWENYGGTWTGADGEAVFRRTVEIPSAWAGRDLVLSLGAIDDFDTAFFAGEAVGSTDRSVANFWNAPRRYIIPARLVTPGRQVIAVRVFDHFGGGGLVGAPETLFLAPLEPLAPGLYHPDWRDDFPLGDDPARYYRW